MADEETKDADLTPIERRKKELTRKVDRIVADVEKGRSGKRRPVLERIGSMQGRSSTPDGQGFGGLPTLTDQDVAAALAMIRKDRKLVGDDKDIAPEILETYYGSTDTHRAVLRAAYLRANPVPGERVHVMAPCRRMAATLAAQMLAGRTFSRGNQQEFAFICHTRLETMREEIARAFAWYEGRASDAAPAFRRVIDSAAIVRIERAQGSRSARHAEWELARKERLERQEKQRACEAS